ncbi:MAG: NAD(P)-dependent alcohol dehydrogenase [Anaeromyxobacter sp.]
MKALQFDAYGPIERLVLRDVPPPRPRGGPLVRVRAAALNPKDALFRKGRFRLLSGRRFPKFTGVDFAGTVEVPHGELRAGDAVFGALHEWTFARGTLAELVAPRAAEVARLPPGVDPAHAAAIALVGLTALQALRDLARVGPGAEVLVNGASGGVGTAAIQLARLLGARVTTVSSDATAALCRSLGAAETAGYGELEGLLASGRFDAVFDVFGNLRFARARGALRRRGVFVSTVPSPRRLLREVASRLSRHEERLVVVRPNRADLDALGAWLQAGALRAVVDGRFPLAAHAEAFRRLESKHAHGKLVIDVG